MRLRDKLFALGLVVLYGLNVLDFALTHVALGYGCRELNPIFAECNFAGGQTPFSVLYKVVFLGLATALFGTLYLRDVEECPDFLRFLWSCFLTGEVLLYVWADLRGLLLLLGLL